MNTNNMKIGGACFLLVTESNGERAWQGSEQGDWFIEDTTVKGRETRAATELGVKRLHGLTCLVFLCDDERVRAVPMKAIGSAR